MLPTLTPWSCFYDLQGWLGFMEPEVRDRSKKQACTVYAFTNVPIPGRHRGRVCIGYR